MRPCGLATKRHPSIWARRGLQNRRISVMGRIRVGRFEGRCGLFQKFSPDSMRSMRMRFWMILKIQRRNPKISLHSDL